MDDDDIFAKEVWAWSDGSGCNSKYGWGVFFKRNSYLNNKGRTYLVHSVFEGELMGFEYILDVLPLHQNIRIFVDCQSVIDIVKSNTDMSFHRVRNNKNKYIIRRIRDNFFLKMIGGMQRSLSKRLEVITRRNLNRVMLHKTLTSLIKFLEK